MARRCSMPSCRLWAAERSRAIAASASSATATSSCASSCTSAASGRRVVSPEDGQSVGQRPPSRAHDRGRLLRRQRSHRVLAPSAGLPGGAWCSQARPRVIGRVLHLGPSRSRTLRPAPHLGCESPRGAGSVKVDGAHIGVAPIFVDTDSQARVVSAEGHVPKASVDRADTELS